MKLGYYLTLGDQIAETQDHVNLLWLDDSRLTPAQIAEATKLGKTVVLDVEGCLFDAEHALRPDATERLQALRSYIKLHGNLSAVEVIVPRDEPDMPGRRNVTALLPAAVALIRDAWPEARVGCIYCNDSKFPHRHLFDIVGFDDYGAAFSICQPMRWWNRITLFFGLRTRRGLYLRLAEMLRPDQQTWLIPGGTYGERPERWMEFAATRQEVWAVVPFLWASAVDGQTELVGIRARDDVRDAYVSAGRKVCGVYGPTNEGLA